MSVSHEFTTNYLIYHCYPGKKQVYPSRTRAGIGARYIAPYHVRLPVTEGVDTC